MAVDPSAIERAFERAPALVERLVAEAPYASIDRVIARARSVLASMTERDRALVLDAHPRIGAARASLSPESAREQGADGDPAARQQLAELNEAYERRHGFRFVVFVAARPRSAIVSVLKARLERSREDEMATGIDEFLAIARDRLEHPSQGRRLDHPSQGQGQGPLDA